MHVKNYNFFGICGECKLWLNPVFCPQFELWKFLGVKNEYYWNWNFENSDNYDDTPNPIAAITEKRSIMKNFRIKLRGYVSKFSVLLVFVLNKNIISTYKINELHRNYQLLFGPLWGY